jgi:hypothetical protein
LNGEKQEKKEKKTSNTWKNQMQKNQTQNTQIMNHIAITKAWIKMEEKKTKCEKKGKVAFYVFKMCKLMHMLQDTTSKNRCIGYLTTMLCHNHKI